LITGVAGGALSREGFMPAGVEFLNRETAAFLDGVTPSAAR
jgi:hypothetical protein